MTTLVVGSEVFEGTADAKRRRKTQRQYNTGDNNIYRRDRSKKTNEYGHSTNLSISDLWAAGRIKGELEQACSSDRL
jgi:hypothetical protein